MLRSPLVALIALSLAGCPKAPASTDVAPTVADAADEADAMQIYAELEALIADGRDSEDDRQFALDGVQKIEDDGTAEYAFARAALLGRVAELRGVKAGKLVTGVERYARLSIERDPEFKGKAATRMLGSLYVMAPPRLVEHGDSETGLELLEALADEHPDEPLNHLRVAEAFIHLGDPEPALPHLCTTLAVRDTLRADDQALLGRLVADAGGDAALGCGGEAADA